ncbi:Omp28-related outer membrane protein [Candidatus Amoebophilus asiaticus]|nr:Omp28-related outer membrane protein [Candidatus Amoebophilus asiaticus]
MLILLFAVCFSCNKKEEEPEPTPTSTTLPDTVKRVVLIEEFTGVRCSNCPLGSEKIDSLIQANPGKIIAISIHGGTFAVPLDSSKYDFRTDEGNLISDSLVAPPLGYPAADINRKLFPNENSVTILMKDWETYVDQELLVLSPVRIKISNISWNSTNRSLGVKVSVTYHRDVATTNYISLCLTENNIVDLQQRLDSVNQAYTDYNYVHNHVLRDMFTAYDGEVITGTKNNGHVFTKDYNMTLDALWNENNCKIVAFVHHRGDSLNVVQAAHAKVIQ